MWLGVPFYRYVTPPEFRNRPTLPLERRTLSCNPRPVRRRSKILLLGACILIALIAVCFFCLRDNEPSYNGRTLSAWLRVYGDASVQSEQKENSRQSVIAIGTNAIPALLKWTTFEQLQRDRRYFALWRRLPHRILKNHFIISVALRTMEHIAIAQDGFSILGTNAIPAIPELSRRFCNTTNREQADIAAISLQCMGEPGFQFFTNAIVAGWTKSQTLMAIGAIGPMRHRLGTNVLSAVPLLIATANTSDVEIADKAASTLADLGACADQVVPVIVRRLNSTNAAVRSHLIYCLLDFGDAAKTAIPAVRVAAINGDDDVRHAAEYFLSHVGQVRTNVSSSYE